ncbi:MAG: hypothetical protein WC756_07465 [Taibaiella sp.]
MNTINWCKAFLQRNVDFKNKYVTAFILMLCLFTQQVNGQQYNPIKLFDLATGADLVTYGVITKLEERFFYLNCFNERKKKAIIRIPKFIGRTGSYRWEQYTVGQQVFVFLKKINNEYVLMGSGAEAEIPVLKDSLVVDMNCFMPKTIQSLAPKGLTPEYRKVQTFDVGKKKVFGLLFSPRYLYQSIMSFRDCYQVILKKPNTYASFSCFNFFDRYIREKINVQKQKFKLMKLMYLDMEEAQSKNCKY